MDDWWLFCLHDECLPLYGSKISALFRLRMQGNLPTKWFKQSYFFVEWNRQ